MARKFRSVEADVEGRSKGMESRAGLRLRTNWDQGRAFIRRTHLHELSRLLNV